MTAPEHDEAAELAEMLAEAFDEDVVAFFEDEDPS